MAESIWSYLLAFASILLFAFFAIDIGPWIGEAIFSWLANASPILDKTVLGHITFFAIVGVLADAVANVLARLVNFAFNGWLAKRVGLGQRIRAMFDEDGKMVLELFAIPSMFIGFVFYRTELRLLEAGKLTPIIGVYQDAIISGVAMATLFELLVVLCIVTTYDIVK